MFEVRVEDPDVFETAIQALTVEATTSQLILDRRAPERLREQDYRLKDK